jgi:hypothetical protein
VAGVCTAVHTVKFARQRGCQFFEEKGTVSNVPKQTVTVFDRTAKGAADNGKHGFQRRFTETARYAVIEYKISN